MKKTVKRNEKKLGVGGFRTVATLNTHLANYSLRARAEGKTLNKETTDQNRAYHIVIGILRTFDSNNSDCKQGEEPTPQKASYPWRQLYGYLWVIIRIKILYIYMIHCYERIGETDELFPAQFEKAP